MKSRSVLSPAVLAVARLPVRILPLLLAACTGGGTPEQQQPAQRPDSVPSVSAAELPERGEFVDNALRVAAETRDEFRASLGEPDRVSQEIVPNRHMPGVQDTIFTLHYPDLVARIHHPGGAGDLLSMVEVSANRHLRYPAIGLDQQAIEQAFGPPDEASGSTLTYHCTSCVAGDNPVELMFEDDELRRVRFNYYVD